MKEKLKKTIVKIVWKSMGKWNEKSFKGIHLNDQDHFYSNLYQHLVSQVHLCLNEMVTNKKDELHEDVVVSFDTQTSEYEKLM